MPSPHPRGLSSIAISNLTDLVIRILRKTQFVSGFMVIIHI